jgi:hypothetical protein
VVTWLQKAWTWSKGKWWLVLPVLLIGVLLVIFRGAGMVGSIARAIGGKPDPTPPPGTLTKKEAQEARADLERKAEATHEAIETGRAAAHRDDDDWLRNGGAPTDPRNRPKG